MEFKAHTWASLARTCIRHSGTPSGSRIFAEHKGRWMKATTGKTRIRYLQTTSKFTPVNGSCRRYCKDLLSTGAWRVGRETWNVTRQTLATIVENFDRGRRLGLDCPLVWNHSDDARDRLGRVVGLSVFGNTLWGVVEVCDSVDAAQMLKVNQVSVGCSDGWRDGYGNSYAGDFLVHVGVVNHPVVSGQGPFRSLGQLSQGETARTRTRERGLNMKRLWESGLTGKEIRQHKLNKHVLPTREQWRRARCLAIDPDAETAVGNAIATNEVVRWLNLIFVASGTLEDLAIDTSNSLTASELMSRMAQIESILKRRAEAEDLEQSSHGVPAGSAFDSFNVPVYEASLQASRRLSDVRPGGGKSLSDCDLDFQRKVREFVGKAR